MIQEKIIGVGNTSDVYEWGEGKVLKLFRQGYPKDAIEKEFCNAKAINDLDFPKPRVYELTIYSDRMGIVYHRLEGVSLLEWVLKTRDVQSCAIYMAKLHKAILQNRVSNVPHYKVFLKNSIVNAISNDSEKQEEVLQMLDGLQDGDTLCHGDFHPGNIFISEDHTMVLDFMNVCRGYYLYDVARTVYLVQYTPVPADVEDKKMFMQLKKTLADLYLAQMSISREIIDDYLSVISIARAGECVNE